MGPIMIFTEFNRMSGTIRTKMAPGIPAWLKDVSGAQREDCRKLPG
jgi:hypothetical protein